MFDASFDYYCCSPAFSAAINAAIWDFYAAVHSEGVSEVSSTSICCSFKKSSWPCCRSPLAFHITIFSLVFINLFNLARRSVS